MFVSDEEDVTRTSMMRTNSSSMRWSKLSGLDISRVPGGPQGGGGGDSDELTHEAMKPSHS